MNRRSVLRTLASLPILGIAPVQAVERDFSRWNNYPIDVILIGNKEKHRWIKNPYHRIFFKNLDQRIQSPAKDILFKLEDSGKYIIIEMIRTNERWKFPTTESPPNQGSFYEEQIRLYPDSKIDFYDIRYKNLSNIFAKITT
jgi:hypothetical protein